jgi:hypothetical protein
MKRPGKSFRTSENMLMRLMASDRLDARTLNAPKQGFSGPVRKWIVENRQVFFERTMAVRDIPCVANIPVEDLWRDEEMKTNPRWAAEVFSLYCFATWYHAHAGSC